MDLSRVHRRQLWLNRSNERSGDVAYHIGGDSSRASPGRSNAARWTGAARQRRGAARSPSTIVRAALDPTSSVDRSQAENRQLVDVTVRRATRGRWRRMPHRAPSVGQLRRSERNIGDLTYRRRSRLVGKGIHCDRVARHRLPECCEQALVDRNIVDARSATE